MTQEYKADYTGWLKYLEQLGYRKVVLCKDCKHWGGEYADNECSLLTRLAYPKFWVKTQQDDFCSSGERKPDHD